MKKTDQIRALAQDLIDFANRADRLGIKDEEIAVIVSVPGSTSDEDSLIVTGGVEDDKNAFFYLETVKNIG